MPCQRRRASITIRQSRQTEPGFSFDFVQDHEPIDVAQDRESVEWRPPREIRGLNEKLPDTSTIYNKHNCDAVKRD